VDGWEESSEPIFLSNIQMTQRKFREEVRGLMILKP
jgi:hypothetical protein